jgi:hypothetical protein
VTELTLKDLIDRTVRTAGVERIDALGALGSALHNSDPASAVEVWRKAAFLAKKHQTRQSRALFVYNCAEAEKSSGWYESAIESYLVVIGLCFSKSEVGLNGELLARSVHGLAHCVSREWHELSPGSYLSERSMQRQDQLRVSVNGVWFTDRMHDDSSEIAEFLTGRLSDDLRLLSNTSELDPNRRRSLALRFHAHAISILEKLETAAGDANVREQLARALQCQAASFLEYRAYAQAVSNLVRALSYWNTIEILGPERTARYCAALELLSTCYDSADDSASAEYCFRLSVLLAERELGPSHQSSLAQRYYRFAVWSSRRDLVDSSSYFFKARKIYLADLNYRELAYTDRELSRIFRGRRPLTSIRWLHSALLSGICWFEQTPESDRGLVEQVLHECLSELYSITGQLDLGEKFAEALGLFGVFSTVVESVASSIETWPHSDPFVFHRSLSFSEAESLPENCCTFVAVDLAGYFWTAFIDGVEQNWQASKCKFSDVPGLESSIAKFSYRAPFGNGASRGIELTDLAGLDLVISDGSKLLPMIQILPVRLRIIVIQSLKSGGARLRIFICANGPISGSIPWQLVPVDDELSIEGDYARIIDGAEVAFTHPYFHFREVVAGERLFLFDAASEVAVLSRIALDLPSQATHLSTRSGLDAFMARSNISLLFMSGHSFARMSRSRPEFGLRFGRSGLIFGDDLMQLASRKSLRSVVLAACSTALSLDADDRCWGGLAGGLLTKGVESVIGTVYPIPEDPVSTTVDQILLSIFASSSTKDEDICRFRVFQLELLTRLRRNSRDAISPIYWASYVCCVLMEDS